MIPIVTIPYLSRVLQPEAVGVLSYSESIVAYFTLFAVLGSAVYAQREIGKVQDDRSERSKAFWEIQIIRTVSSAVAIGAYLIYTFVVQTNLIICLILALEILNVILDINWFFQGLEEFGKTVAVGLIVKILNLIVIFVFVKSPSDLWIYALSKCGFGVLGNLSLWLLLPKYLCKTEKIKPFRHLKEILMFFIPAIATQVYMILDKSMIGWFTVTREENGYYEYAERITRMTITIIAALAAVLIPRVSKAYAEGGIDSVRGIAHKAVTYVWLLALPICLGLLAVADVFVPIFLGDSYAKVVLLVQIFTPLVVFVGMANIIGLAFLIPINKQRVYLVSVVIAAVVNLIMNLILIPRFYSVGAAISSVTAEGVGIIIQVGYVFKKRLLSAKKFFLSAVKYLISAAVMFAVVFVMKLFVLPATVWGLVVLILLGVVVYLLGLLALRDKILLDTAKKVISKFKKSGAVTENAESENQEVAEQPPAETEASEIESEQPSLLE